MIRRNILSARFLTSLNLLRGLKSSVRVRFAPSPTGHLHLGGLRTALYNYLFCLSHEGRMILRIEDTDQSRKVEGAAEALEKNLEWAGVYCHESPTVGGNYGPYVQSERCDIYQKHVEQLVDSGLAYPCFCTDRRLDLLRREAFRTRQIPRYDNRCRYFTPEEVGMRISKGEQHCIRFKLSSDCNVFTDLVYGSIAYDVSQVEGDPVILKSDGFPTYHLANVVDDHLMRISHVLRGVEWQISTTKHILLYRAFGWEPPEFGHLPLIMNADGSKLSKRQGDIRIQDYQRKGIFPEALVNYVTLAGGGFDRVQGAGITAATMDELAMQFHLECVNSHCSRLSPELLAECNRLEIIEQLKDSSKTDLLVGSVLTLLQTHFPDKKLQASPQRIRQVLLWSAGRITTLQDLVTPSLAFLWVLPSVELKLKPCNKKVLESLNDKLSCDSLQFQCATLKTMLREFSEKNGIKFNELMKLLRSVLSGLDEGPGVAEMMEVLGRRDTILRISTVIKINP